MELPIVIVLLVSCLSTVTSHPKKSDAIPKDYYKRQILQPIPGYIPVYIQTEEEPVVRSEKLKHDSHFHSSEVVKDKTQIENKEAEEKKSENFEKENASETEGKVAIEEKVGNAESPKSEENPNKTENSKESLTSQKKIDETGRN